MVLFAVLLGCKDNAGETNTAPIHREQSPQLKASIDRGAALYNNFCASCHLSSGEGIPGVFPPLNLSDWLIKRQEESIHAIKYGLKGPIKVNGEKYDNLMPALGLSHDEIADVMNYINNAWENDVDGMVTKEEVAAIEK